MKHFTLCVLFACCAQILPGQFIEKHNFPSLADTKTIDGNEISFSFGQSLTTTFNGSQFILTQGFHQPLNLSTVNTQNILSEENYEIFPNPNMGSFRFKLHASESLTGKIQIRNVLGQLISEQAIVDQSSFITDFNLSSQESGIYLLQFISETNTILISQKIIVQF